jgi:hypothetical protein
MLLGTQANAQAPLPIYGYDASSSYPGAGPANAVDGNPSTAWNAGTTGATSPFIQIDLGGEVQLSRLELVVSQWPNGFATHQFTGYTSAWATVNLGTFSNNTYEGLTIVHQVNNPTPVRWVRITTTYNASWVAWYEIRAYKPVPVGNLTAPSACTVPYNAGSCGVQLQATISPGAYGRVWVTQAPPGAPELNQWVFDTAVGSTYVNWIRPGTYKFELREGSSMSGALLSSAYVTGQQQAPPPAKLFGYYGTWSPGLNVDSISATADHANLVWAIPWLDPSSLKALLRRSDVQKVVLDGTGILFGSASCGGSSQPVTAYFDGTCTPTDSPHLLTASQRYQYLLSQLTYSEYQKIVAVFPLDEPDIYPNLTHAHMAAAKEVLAQVPRSLFGSTATIPKLGIMYSWAGIPMNSLVTPIGASSADWAAVNCYPVSYGYATASSPSACGSDGAPTLVQRFNRLKQLVPGKKYFLVAETALKQSRDDAQGQGRRWLAENLTALRRVAQSDSSVLGIIGFNWRGLNPAYDVSGGEFWKGPPGLAGAPYDFRVKVVQEGQCVTQLAQGQCP